MEECSVVIQLPGHGDRIEGTDEFRFNQLSVFDVYRLNAPKPLDVRKLSYNTKPPAQERVASLMAKGGEETLVTSFPCPWGTLHTFEVVCGEGSDCLVDIWSSQNTTYGESLSSLPGGSDAPTDSVSHRHLHVSASNDMSVILRDVCVSDSRCVLLFPVI